MTQKSLNFAPVAPMAAVAYFKIVFGATSVNSSKTILKEVIMATWVIRAKLNDFCVIKKSFVTTNVLNYKYLWSRMK